MVMEKLGEIVVQKTAEGGLRVEVPKELEAKLIEFLWVVNLPYRPRDVEVHMGGIFISTDRLPAFFIPIQRA